MHRPIHVGIIEYLEAMWSKMIRGNSEQMTQKKLTYEFLLFVNQYQQKSIF